MDKLQDVLPPFDKNGNLPPGIHHTTYDEFYRRFVRNGSLKRKSLFSNFSNFYSFIKHYSIAVYVDGSFITKKLSPDDIDILVVLPFDFQNNPFAVSRLREFQNQGKFHLHIFAFFFAINQKEIDRFISFFSFDRNNNNKGLVMVENKNDKKQQAINSNQEKII